VSADEQALTFRFRPRYRALPLLCIAISFVLILSALIFDLQGSSRLFALVGGTIGTLLGTIYFAMPLWRYAVVVDDDKLIVRHGTEEKLRLPWSDVVRVIASPSTKTLFLDGGGAARSLLVPGPGASGPYMIERREQLYDAILARVPAERVTQVESLETWKRT
jgi:hypothetical protein